MKYRIDVDQVSYHNNSLADNTPSPTPADKGGYEHVPQKVSGNVTRGRSESFNDFYTQPRILWNSMSPIEKQHTIDAFSYQLGSVEQESIRQQNVDILVNVDRDMAITIADNIGVERPEGSHVDVSTSYPSLSQANAPKSAHTQKVGVLITNGFDDEEVTSMLTTLKENGVFTEIVSETLQAVTGANGTVIHVDRTFMTTSPYLLDSLYVVGGNAKNDSKFNYDLNHFIQVAFEHYKPIGVANSAAPYFQTNNRRNSPGVIFAENNANFHTDFINAVAHQRFFERQVK